MVKSKKNYRGKRQPPFAPTLLNSLSVEDSPVSDHVFRAGLLLSPFYVLLRSLLAIKLPYPMISLQYSLSI